MTTSHLSYCQSTDVYSRLFEGQSSPALVTGDPTKDAYLSSLCQVVSRRFEKLTGQGLNAFAPIYEPRIFGGKGAQNISTDPFASIKQIEINVTPGAMVPSWQDYTADFADNQAVVLPMRLWPKQMIWRMNTWYVDAYQTGQVRIHGVWGLVQPDFGATQPAAIGYGPGAISDPVKIAALAPWDADGNVVGGWWVTPEDVVDALAKWVVLLYRSGQGGMSEEVDVGGDAKLPYPWSVPKFVKDVAEEYSPASIRVAGITADGVDIADERVYGSQAGSPDYVSRWVGWYTS